MVSYQDIPKSYVDKNDKQVYYYRRKTLANGSKSKYVYIHENEKHEIIHWLNRLVIDLQAKQVIDHTFLDELFERTDNLKSSPISHKKNSYITYAAGVVSNIMRNPTQDLSVDQLKDVEEVYRVINRVYSVELANELGYNNVTKKNNPVPKQIKFKPA
jgi:hypothetical protein